MNLNGLEILRFVPLILLFAYAAYLDHRQGWIPNWIWLYTPVGFTLLLVQLFYQPYLALYSLVVTGFCVAFGFILFQFGVGGADCKALMMLGLCYPLTPNIIVYPLFVIVIASFLVGIKVLISKQKVNLKTKVRFLPYFFIGMIAVILING